MKNKEIISGVVGGALFALPYLALSVPLGPSVFIGVAGAVATNLVMSPTKIKIKGYSMSIEDVLEEAEKENKELKRIIFNIEDVDLKNDLKNIVDVVSKINNAIKDNPSKAEKIDTFYEYYLPVTLKIIRKYDKIEDKKLNSKDSMEFKKSSKKMIKEASGAFEKLLDSLYQEEIVDTDAEMKVFKSMLESDGYNNNGINLEKEANNE